MEQKVLIVTSAIFRHDEYAREYSKRLKSDITLALTGNKIYLPLKLD